MFAYETTKVVIGLSVFGAMLAVVAHAWGFR
jgi:hypothetical protein